MRKRTNLVAGVFPIGDVPVGLSDEKDDAGKRADEEESGREDTHDGQLGHVLVATTGGSHGGPSVDGLTTSYDQCPDYESVADSDDDERHGTD